MKVYQDGADFYQNVDDFKGNLKHWPWPQGKTKLFTASIRVKDFDLEAVEIARDEFLKWVHNYNLEVEFEDA